MLLRDKMIAFTMQKDSYYEIGEIYHLQDSKNLGNDYIRHKKK